MLPDSVRRWRLGLLVGIAAVLVIAVPVSFIHDRLSLATPALLLVLPVLLAAVLGGRWRILVSKLRKTLGEGDGVPRIATEPYVGYRLVSIPMTDVPRSRPSS